MKRTAVVISIVLLVTAVLGTVAYGQEFGPFKAHFTQQNMFYGTRAMGMGNAFTAISSDLSCVFRNPAGIALFNGPQVYLDYRADRMSYYYQPQTSTSGSTTSTYTYDMKSDLDRLNFISISAPVMLWDMKWNFALSYYRYLPYGYKGTAQGVDSAVTGSTTTNQTTTLSFGGSSGIDVLAFSSAFFMSNDMSLGLTLQKFINSGETVYDFTSPTLSYHSVTSEKYDGLGLIMGMQFYLSKDITFGLSYHFKTTATLTTDLDYLGVYGTTGSSTTSTAKMTLPSQIHAGFMFRPYNYLMLSFDYSIIYWSNAKLTNYFGSSTEYEFPARNDYSFSQKDAVNYRLGAEINIPVKSTTFYLRAGLFSDSQLFLDGASSSVKVKGHSFGAGVDISNIARLDVAYMFQKGEWPETAYYSSGSTVDSTFKNRIFSMSVTFSFEKRQN